MARYTLFDNPSVEFFDIDLNVCSQRLRCCFATSTVGAEIKDDTFGMNLMIGTS